MAWSRLFGLLFATLSRSLFNVFYIHLALDSSNSAKICLDSPSRILESCPLVSLYSLLTTWNKSMPSVSSLPQDYILQFRYVQVFPEVNIILF